MKTNRLNAWKTRLNVETLEERALMSASPLNWTAPTGTPNAILLGVVGSQIQIFDNGQLVAHQNVADTSAITITTAGRVNNTINILGTPAGLQTTINLKGLRDAVVVGDAGSANHGGNPLQLKIVTKGTTPAGTLANINGALAINGTLAGRDSVTLDDAADTGSHKVVIGGGSVTGLAPAAITFSGIGSLTINGSGGGSGYAITAGTAHTELTTHGVNNGVGVSSTSGTVIVHGSLFDTAFITGAATGVNTLTAGPGGATLRGAGYSTQVLGFMHISATSKSASDVATLIGANGGGNTLTASPTGAELSQGVDHVNANGFAQLTGIGSGSASDVATLTGAATGTNFLNAALGDVFLSGRGYVLHASKFDTVNAYSLAPNDTAALSGSYRSANTLHATPTQATLVSSSGFVNSAFNFHTVTAYRSNAADSADLSGASGTTNYLVASPASVTLSAAGATVTALSFPSVTASSGSAGDVASFSGKGSFLTATPTVTQLSGPGFFVQASNFPTSYESLTAQAFEWTSGGALLEQVSLVNKAFALRAVPGAGSGIHTILSNWLTVDSAFHTVAFGNLVNANYAWDLNGTGVHTFGPDATAAVVNIELTLSVLNDASLEATLFRAMVRDGGLDYTAMLDAFNTVEAEGTVSSGTLGDLQFIVRCASSLLMPADVQDLTNSVVNGERANSHLHWLDSNGNVASGTLGNLQVGSTGAQLALLVDLWFCGIDEPFADRAYSAVSGSLYGSGGPVYTDVRQGQVGDCWLMASIAEVAAREPAYVKSMFAYEGTNTVNGATVSIYSVRLYSNNVAHYVTVDTELPAGGTYYDYAGNGVLWAALLEKAYAEASGAGWAVTSHDAADSYSVLDSGWPSYALPTLTNWSTAEQQIDASTAATAWQAGDFVVLCTGGSPSSNAIVPNHAYALVGFDPSSSTPFKLYNPWGTDANGNAGTYNGHTVYGLFNATGMFLMDNFEKESIAAAVPTAPTVPTAPQLDLDALAAALVAVARSHRDAV